MKIEHAKHGTYSGYAGEGCRCDECRRAGREYCKARYARDGERLRRANRAYYQEHKERLIAYSKESWEKRRDGRADKPKPDACEVCGSEGKIVLDHDHDVNEFRGWLCNGCNVALGHAGDDPDRLRKLADYLEAM